MQTPPLSVSTSFIDLCVSVTLLQLSVAHPDDWARFARTLVEIRANRADGEEEGPVELAS